ncbi:hypothetical protein K466DRAFT_569237 [Polyporus arcularius HHB13444]|uniref:Uncharacterized protein n=1 Tax=Polyporus arcularius HHB13444 TaxID=1314778 RepID=A0A5C3NUZ6_9APHY|nr:hypothetical protein K466DRAFT_569237 [Polyporus arcularius HHB13444]
MEKNNPNKSHRLDQKTAVTSPTASPVVLVPETPRPLDDIPIATEDESTPTPATPPSPTSYAQVAALPAARTNVVVWPRNPVTVSSSPSTPTLGQRAIATDTEAGVPRQTISASTRSEEEPACVDRAEDTSISLSSLPSSSPIRYTASPSPTPAPAANSCATLSIPRTLGTIVEQEGDPYDNFWAQVRTPTLPASNMPSALQTPRLLTPQTNENLLDALWPTQTQANRVGPTSGSGGDENRPPTPLPADSHPPVASRMRKRRRGASPISGERVRKSARRKGKGRAKETAPERAPDTENPWATSTPRDVEPGVLQRMPPPSHVSPRVSLSANHTPYEDFSRTGSASVSFYGRFNESGSYPTPHRTSDSPAPPADPPMLEDTPRPPSALSLASNGSHNSRRDVSASSRYSMEIETDAGIPQAEAPPGSTTLEQLSRRIAAIRRAQASGQDTRRPPRASPSDPGRMDERPSVYRSPTIEEIPEEGEIHSAFRSRTGNRSYRWAMDDYSRGDVFSPRPATGNGISEASTGGPECSGSRLRGWKIPGGMGRQHQRRASSRPADRINHLDVFDLGEDDNLPDAVRRGGAPQEGEEESQTPIPHKGDPEVHKHDLEAHLRGMSDDWIQAVWADPNDTSITLSTFNPRFTRSYGTNKKTATDLRSAIARITGETAFLVIAPDQAPNYKGRGPVEWAITRLTPDGVARLLNRRVWSFPSITFFPHRRALENPRWLLALEGFLEDNVGNIEAAVRSTFERPQVKQRIVQMIRANPEFNSIPVDEAVRRIMATLRVTASTTHRTFAPSHVSPTGTGPKRLEVRHTLSTAESDEGLSQPPHGPRYPQTGSSRPRRTDGDDEWEETAFGQGRTGNRNLGRERTYDQDRRGPPRRGRKEGTGPYRQGREGARKDGRH